MNGGLTHQELELRKIKAANCDEALEWIEGRIDSEKLLTVQDILRRGISVDKRRGISQNETGGAG